MSRYHTTSSSLFLEQSDNQIPKWMEQLSDVKVQEQEKLDIGIEKKASFADAPRVSRDGRDFSAKEVKNKYNNERMLVDARVELAKFLSGKYYRTKEQVATAEKVVFETTINNVPGKFVFQFNEKNGKVAYNKTFFVETSNGTETYPFSIAGLKESIEDIKLGRIKTAEKAKVDKYYTITLENILRRFNGDSRAAMDRIRELIASDEIVGVESNTFASIYSMDSLFPQMVKEAVKEPSTFEFSPNKEHVAAKPNSSSSKLQMEVGKVFHSLFDDFKIKKSFRKDNILYVNADVKKNGITKTAEFKFNIYKDKLDQIIACTNDNQNLTLEQFLNDMHHTNLLDAYLKQNDNKSKKIYKHLVFSRNDIQNKLMRIASKQVISKIIDNWCERELVTPISTNIFITKLSFLDLLNKVNTKLLSENEKTAFEELTKRITANLNRIKQKDTGIRNDKDWLFSKSIRTANVYNVIANMLTDFKIKEINDDATKLVIQDKSDGTLAEVIATISYDGNRCKHINWDTTKEKTEAIKLYAKKLNQRKLRFAKSVFSERMLKDAIEGIYHEDVIRNVLASAKDLGNGFYASNKPLSAIIDELDHKYKPLNKEQRAQIIKAKQYFGKKIEASYINDTGVRNEQKIEFTNSIRMANLYNELSKRFSNFKIVKANKDATEVDIFVSNALGNDSYNIIADYEKNSVRDIKVSYLDSAMKNHKLVSNYVSKHGKKNIFAKSVFSKNMVKNAIKHMVYANDLDMSVDKICNLAEDIGNDFYASDKPLIYLINISDIPFTPMYEEQIQFSDKVTRNNVTDTGVRSEFTENEVALINQASNYLSKQFNDFKLAGAIFEDGSLNYSLILFDEETGLTNKMDFIFTFEDGHVKECKCKLNDKIVDLKDVKTAFASNNILKKYLKYHQGKRKNSNVVFSANQLANSLRNIVNMSREDISSLLDNWQRCGRLEKISGNLYASNHTIEQLLSLSNLKPLSDEEIKHRLKKSSRNELKRFSANYAKDTKERRIVNEWTEEQFVAFVRSELNKLYRKADILDAKLTDDSFTVKARVNYKGIRRIQNLTWKVKNSRPISATLKIDKLDDITEKYLSDNRCKTSTNNIIFSKKQLASNLLGYADIDKIDDICNVLMKHNLIDNLGNEKYASKVSIPEIVNMLAKSKLADKEITKEQLARANSHIENVDTTTYLATDASRFVPSVEQELSETMKRVQNKLLYQMQKAASNQQLTQRKFVELKGKLAAVKNQSDLDKVYKEFMKYV